MFKTYKTRLTIAILSLFLLIPLSVHAYVVQQGDTLSRLAYKFGTTISELVRVNNIKNQNLIFTGQYLEIPLQGALLGGNPLPEDNYDTYVTSPVSAADTTIFVNRIPSGITESIYTIFASDGRTVREKIYCTGASSTPNRLTGCARGLSFYPTASGTITEAPGTGLSHSKNSRIAITDNINFSGKALAYLYGNQILPGNLLFNNGAIIGLATPTSSATSSAANVDYVNNVAYAGSPDGSQVVKGIVEIATDSELQNGSADGSGNTTAPLVPHASSFSVSSSPNKVAVASSTGKIDASWGGSSNSLATLNTSTLVVQNPASATSTPTANSIPISSSTAVSIDRGWIPFGFGGTCADGDLTISSGTTTIDLGSASVVTKNYSSVSITGTGALTFSNPNTNGTLIILKSCGEFTVTSTINPAIDLRGLGATGGVGVAGAGGSGTNATDWIAGLVEGGGGGGAGAMAQDGGGGAGGSSAISSGSNGTAGGGSGGTAGTYARWNSSSAPYLLAYARPGSGGGAGGSGNNNTANGANGGRGGGGLYVEVRGSLNFTGIINASGSNGSNGASAGGGNYAGSGGGGGAGTISIMYNTLTANTGTCTVSGGTGGSSAGFGTGGNGASGFCSISKNISL